MPLTSLLASMQAAVSSERESMIVRVGVPNFVAHKKRRERRRTVLQSHFIQKQIVSTSRSSRAQASALEDAIISVLRVSLAAPCQHMRRLQMLG